MNLKRFLARKLLIDLPKQIAIYTFASSKRSGVIFWGHLGLGDLISNAAIIEHLLSKYRLVVIPTKERNYDFLFSTYGSWNGIVISKIRNDPKWENWDVLKIKFKFRYPIQVVGHHFLPKDWDLEQVSLNEQFQRLAGIPDAKLQSARFRGTCSNLTQVDIPKGRYIFVDDHPGTEREIPQIFLREAIESGVRIIRNDISVPLYSMLDTLDKAEEIHMVASAPLCFALTAGAESPKKYYYRTKGQGLVASAAYPDWIDVDLR